MDSAFNVRSLPYFGRGSWRSVPVYGFNRIGMHITDILHVLQSVGVVYENLNLRGGSLMAKFRIEVEIPDGQYCDSYEESCICLENHGAVGVADRCKAAVFGSGNVYKGHEDGERFLKHTDCPNPYKRPLMNYMVDVAFEIESRKEFEDLTREEIFSAIYKRLETLSERWQPEAFGLCDEHEIDESEVVED